MKRFFVTLSLTIVIFGALIYAMPRNFDSYVADISQDGIIYIYCRATELESIDMGNGKIVECNAADFSTVLSKCQGVDGVSVRFNGTLSDVTRVVDMFGLTVVSSYELDGLYVTCGKSDKIAPCVIIDGNVVNLQIAYKDGVVTVGSPLILGSY